MILVLTFVDPLTPSYMHDFIVCYVYYSALLWSGCRNRGRLARAEGCAIWVASRRADTVVWSPDCADHRALTTAKRDNRLFERLLCATCGTERFTCAISFKPV